MGSISHRRAKELLEQAQHHELLAVDAQLLDYHLHSCADCRRYALALNEFDLTLTESLQRRWNTRRIRLSDVQQAQNAVQHATARPGWMRRTARTAMNVAWVSLISLLLIGFVQVVSGFTLPASPPEEEDTSRAADHPATTTYIQTFQRTDLNCDNAAETLFLQREVAANLDADLMDSSPFPTTALIVQNATGTRWTFNASDVGSDYIQDQFLLQTSACSSLLAATTGGGATWFVVFEWDGSAMHQVLRAPGMPAMSEITTEDSMLLPGAVIKIQENDKVNTARCNAVTAAYQWDGIRFHKANDAIASPFCAAEQ